MTAYKSKARSFKDALVPILQAVQLDAGNGDEPAFALVTDDPGKAFNQEPYCLVFPGKSEDTVAANRMVDRDQGYLVIMLLSLENGQRNQPETYNLMYDLTELCLDALDASNWNDALNTPTNLGTWWLQTSHNEPVVGESKGATFLIGTINVNVHYSKSF